MLPRGEAKMCGCCHDEWGCHGWHTTPEPRAGWRYFEPTPEDRREYLEEEKNLLEERLKEIEARITQAK